MLKLFYKAIFQPMFQQFKCIQSEYFMRDKLNLTICKWKDMTSTQLQFSEAFAS